MRLGLGRSPDHPMTRRRLQQTQQTPADPAVLQRPRNDHDPRKPATAVGATAVTAARRGGGGGLTGSSHPSPSPMSPPRPVLQQPGSAPPNDSERTCTGRGRMWGCEPQSALNAIPAPVRSCRHTCKPGCPGAGLCNVAPCRAVQSIVPVECRARAPGV